MSNLKGRRYWLVGASEGLGRALAYELATRGARLVLSARSQERLDRLAEDLPEGTTAIPMDITDAASVTAAASEAGDIDGMVFLAATYWPMTAQDWDTEKAIAMGDVNYTGALRVLGAVLPEMIARDAGHLVITGSLAGYGGLPGAIGYASSKAAVMSLAECLQADLRCTGVRVQLANPGFIRTRLTDLNDFRMPGLMEPEVAARQVADLMEGRRFRRSFPTAFASLFRLGRFLPDRLYFPLFAPGRRG